MNKPVMLTYHNPVLLDESIDGLQIKTDGIYVDATFGGGSHSLAILNQLGPDGRLVGFDKDTHAAANDLNDQRFYLVNHDYAYLSNFLRYLNLSPVDGILADLGIASHHLEVENRGFTHRSREAPLDMRMDENSPTTAANILNKASEKTLHEILGKYGEVKNARQVAKAIVEKREKEAFELTGQLIDLLKETIHGHDRQVRYQSQVFQALRIAVNQELESLEVLLQGAPDLLKPNGRLVVITYHSLEDRLVKNFFKTGNLRGEQTKDIYGNTKASMEQVNRKPITPSEAEIAENNRARSAKLRIARKKAMAHA